jgi:hypothetical protein
METIDYILTKLIPVSLLEMDKVKLMDRVDTKFICSSNDIPLLLSNISNEYQVLEINGFRVMPYKTTYFDTQDFQMFKAHQNGKLNRYKIRQREYSVSGLNFLEVKFKNNKGRTLKSRIEKSMIYFRFTRKEEFFLHYRSPYGYCKLEPKLHNSFKRITLVNSCERITIDFDLTFSLKNGESISLPDLGIIEVKQGKYNRNSKILDVLKQLNIRPSGFSKYCMGISLLQQDIKSNSFKSKLLLINKLIA